MPPAVPSPTPSAGEQDRSAPGTRTSTATPADVQSVQQDDHGDQPVREPPVNGILEGPALTSPLPQESLGVLLLRRLNSLASRTAMVDTATGETSTYEDLVRESVRLARALKVLLHNLDSGNQQSDGSDAKTRSQDGASGGGRVSTDVPQGSSTGDRADSDSSAGRSKKDNALENRQVDEQSRKGAAGHPVGENEKEEKVVIGVYSENRKELVQALIANLTLGVPVSMPSPLCNTGELVRAWSLAAPSVALCSWAVLRAVLDAAPSLPSLRHVIVFPGDVPDDVKEAAADDAHWDLQVLQYAQLVAGVQGPSSEEGGKLDVDALVRGIAPAEPLDPRTHTAFLMECNRGNRLAKLTHANLIYTVQLLQEPASGYGWSSEDVLLLPVPLTHAFGLGIGLGALALGARLVLVPAFREQLLLSAVQMHKVTQLVLSPPQAALLAHSPSSGLEDVLVPGGLGLSGAVCAAAPLSRALHRNLARRLQLQQDADARQAYGLTQASCSLLVAPRGSPPDTQGRVVPGAQAKIVDVSTGEPVGPLLVGELLVRAPSVMAGYYRDAAATREVLGDDGWLRTGDFAYYDHNGFLYVVDRLKDVVLYTRGHFKEFSEISSADE